MGHHLISRSTYPSYYSDHLHHQLSSERQTRQPYVHRCPLKHCSATADRRPFAPYRLAYARIRFLDKTTQPDYASIVSTIQKLRQERLTEDAMQRQTTQSAEIHYIYDPALNTSASTSTLVTQIYRILSL